MDIVLMLTWTADRYPGRNILSAVADASQGHPDGVPPPLNRGR
jgi:hypothetical protein